MTVQEILNVEKKFRQYRDLIDSKFVDGKITSEQRIRYIDKLDEWQDVADDKFFEKESQE